MPKVHPKFVSSSRSHPIPTERQHRNAVECQCQCQTLDHHQTVTESRRPRLVEFRSRGKVTTINPPKSSPNPNPPSAPRHKHSSASARSPAETAAYPDSHSSVASVPHRRRRSRLPRPPRPARQRVSAARSVRVPAALRFRFLPLVHLLSCRGMRWRGSGSEQRWGWKGCWC